MTSRLDFRITQLSIRHFRAFAALAEHGHFGAAARALGIDQPLLSQTIASLERHLGAPLFVRRPKVRLSPAGKLALPHAMKVLAAATAAATAMADLDAGLEGRLDIGFASWLAVGPIPPLIAAFRKVRPRVAVDFHDLTTAQQLAALERDELDLAFVREGVEGTALSTCLLEAEPMGWICSIGHQLASSPAINAEQVRSSTIILIDRQAAPILHDRTAAALTKSGLYPGRIQHCSHWLTMIGLVRSGVGIGIAPLSLSKLAVPGLIYREDHALRLETSLVACWNPHNVNPALAEFVRFLAARTPG